MEVAAEYGPGVYRHPAAWALEFEPLSLPAMLERIAVAKPYAPIIDFLGRRHSYGEVFRRSVDMAGGLSAIGIGKGDRVGLLLPNMPLYVAAFYAVQRLGAVVVNLSPLASEEELAEQVRRAHVRVLFSLAEPRLFPKAQALLDTTMIERLVVGTIGEDMSAAKALLGRIMARHASVRLPTDPRIMTASALTQIAGPAPLAEIDPLRDVALVHHSSGTTGPPHDVALTHQALSANARQLNAIDPRVSRSQEGDRVIGALPFWHTFGHGCVLHRTVADGGEMVLLPEPSAAGIVAAIVRTGATWMPASVPMLQALAAEPSLATADLGTMRCCIVGGAALTEASRQQFEDISGIPVVEGYGTTETGVIACNPIEGRAGLHSVGQPLPATRFRLASLDDPLQPAPRGEPGELLVNGPQMPLPDGSEDRRFVTCEGRVWLRTGDVGTIDEDGYVRLLERLCELILVGDRRVFPSQVEAILCRHPAVREALVLGRQSSESAVRLEAFVSLIEDETSTGEALRDWLNARVGRHEQVAAVHLRHDLPRTLSGKLSRRALSLSEGDGFVGVDGASA